MYYRKIFKSFNWNNPIFSINKTYKLLDASTYNFFGTRPRGNAAVQAITPKISFSKDLNILDDLSETNESTTNELHHIQSLFPEPKGTLHNFYQLVKNELKTTQTIQPPTPQYKLTGTQRKGKYVWNVIYKLNWPEEIKFDAIGPTKQDASKRAAIKALSWLKRHNRINQNGLPIIYEKAEVKEYNKPLKISFDAKILKKLERINKIYQQDLSWIVNEKLDDSNVKVMSQASFFEIPTLFNTSRTSNKYLDLPILNYREKILRVIADHQVVIIKGEPGCGKSTQVPQYILDNCLDDDNVRIAVSQPRRLAAISLAEHVGKQYENPRLVGYQVRLESSFDQRHGAILYCTSGILLKRIQSDPELRGFTHIVLDEAHERDVNTDMLLVLLRKAIQCNPRLKLIVMSATMDVGLFQEYFNKAPAVHIPGFTYPVKSYYLEDIPLHLPKTEEMCNGDHPQIVPEEICQVIAWIGQTKPPGAILCFLPGWDEIRKVKNYLEELEDDTLLILPLHSRLSNDVQRKIFDPVKEGIRKIILATNIAETSVTINDVVYVIDSGAHKEQRLEKEKSRECIDNYWVSRSNVDQRRGRAGRVRPGESFHLFPKSKYEALSKYAIPEILRVSLTKLVLDTKIYNPQVNAVDFLQEMPNPPEVKAVEDAIDELIALKILTVSEDLTPLGKIVAHYSLPPSLSKALVYSHFFHCSPPVLDIITALSADTEIFVSALIDKTSVRALKRNLEKTSDHLAISRLMDEWREHFSEFTAKNWCEAMQINFNKMFLLSKLRGVHFGYLNELEKVFDSSNGRAKNNELVKGVLLAGLNKILKKHVVIKKRAKKQAILSTEHRQSATISTESVNFKLPVTPSTFFLYSNEAHSLTRRTTIVRETSVLAPLTILLFKNGFTIKSEGEENLVNLEDQYSTLMFTCDNELAQKIMSTREILEACVQYFLVQNLRGERVEDRIVTSWTNILKELDSILLNIK